MVLKDVFDFIFKVEDVICGINFSLTKVQSGENRQMQEISK